MAWPAYLSHLTTFTVISALITLVTAIFGFFLGIADINENKRIIGVPVKTAKRLSIYITLLTGVLTLFLSQKHDFETEREKSVATAEADSVQRKRFDSTLQAIGFTLIKQDTTLYKQGVTLQKQDSTLAATGRILWAQRRELASQALLFDQQRLAFDATAHILHTQISLQDSINRSLTLGTSTQNLVNKTDTGITSINFPVSNGFSVRITARLYVKNLNKILTTGDQNTSELLPQNGNIEDMLKAHGIHAHGQSLSSYWNFFANTTLFWLDHTISLYFDSVPPNNRIVYEDAKAVQAVGSFLANNQIRYNAVQSYLEWDMYVFCGAVLQNPAGIRNLHDVLDRASLFMKLKYIRDKDLSLVGTSGQTEPLSVDRFEIVGVKGVGYGSTGTFVIDNPPFTLVQPQQTAGFVNTWWGLSVPTEDAWRYATVEVNLKNLPPR